MVAGVEDRPDFLFVVVLWVVIHLMSQHSTNEDEVAQSQLSHSLEVSVIDDVTCYCCCW